MPQRTPQRSREAAKQQNDRNADSRTRATAGNGGRRGPSRDDRIEVKSGGYGRAGAREQRALGDGPNDRSHRDVTDLNNSDGDSSERDTSDRVRFVDRPVEEGRQERPVTTRANSGPLGKTRKSSKNTKAIARKSAGGKHAMTTRRKASTKRTSGSRTRGR